MGGGGGAGAAPDPASQTLDGQLVFLEFVSRRVDFPKTRFLQSIVRDISVRKQLEGERERLVGDLAREQNQLQAVLKQAPVGIVVGEAPSGRLILFNDQALKIWHMTSAEANNIAQYAKFRGFHKDGRPYKPEDWPLARSLTTGEVVQNEEADFLCDDGTTGTIMLSSQPIRDNAGNIVAAVVVFQDITELKLTAIKDEFIGMVSHELKNPITVILGALVTAFTPGVSNEESRDLI